MRRSTEDNFWSKVIKTKDCWIWTGSKTPLGYSRFRFNGKTGYAHRYSLSLVEPLIPYLVIDHLCRNRGCVNPDHLEQVTQAQNVVRAPKHVTRGDNRGNDSVRLVCKNGEHKMEADNVKIYKGHRRCRACYNTYARERARKIRLIEIEHNLT